MENSLTVSESEQASCFSCINGEHDLLTMDKIISNVNFLPSGCWEWKGCVNDKGYGQIRVKGKTYYTHRLMYKFTKGVLVPWLTIDHLCMNRSCCNPVHLEQISNRENNRRGNSISAKKSRQTHCIRGHELNGGNLRIRTDTGHRQCVKCIKIRNTWRNKNE